MSDLGADAVFIGEVLRVAFVVGFLRRVVECIGDGATIGIAKAAESVGYTLGQTDITVGAGRDER